jgi:hypothetical protein
MAIRLSALRTGRALLPRNISASGTHLCQRLSKPQGLVRPEGLGNLKKKIHLIRSRTRDLPACSIVPQTSYVTDPEYQYDLQQLLPMSSRTQRRVSGVTSAAMVRSSFLGFHMRCKRWKYPPAPQEEVHVSQVL